MVSSYVYLIASLPMLHFVSKAPFDYEKFLIICQQFIPQEDFTLLKDLPQAIDYTQKEGPRPVLQQWIGFDTALRNELIKIRAKSKHIDPTRYLRGESSVSGDIAHIALSAHRIPSILEAEKFLDQARWYLLSSLEAGHYFDFDFLIIYAYKLMILERWEKINSANKEVLLEQAISKN